MKLKLRDPIDAGGKIKPVADTEFVGQPVVAYLIELVDGYYVSMNHTMAKRGSFTEAMTWIENQRTRG